MNKTYNYDPTTELALLRDQIKKAERALLHLSENKSDDFNEGFKRYTTDSFAEIKTMMRNIQTKLETHEGLIKQLENQLKNVMQSTKEAQGLLTASRAADYLGCPVSSLKNKVYKQIPTVKIGRRFYYEYKDVVEFVEKHKNTKR